MEVTGVGADEGPCRDFGRRGKLIVASNREAHTETVAIGPSELWHSGSTRIGNNCVQPASSAGCRAVGALSGCCGPPRHALQSSWPCLFSVEKTRTPICWKKPVQ